MQSNASKPEFTVRSFHDLIKEWNKGFPDMSTADWRDLVRGFFRLTPEQEKSMTDASPNLVRATQAVFQLMAQHIRKGGQLKGMIRLADDNRRNAVISLVFLDQPFVEPVELTIVCCDANCGDWDWWN